MRLAGRRLAGVAGIALAVGGVPAAGQPNEPVGAGPPGACLKLSEAIEAALQRDPRIDRADALFERATAQVAVERSATRPQLSAFARSGVGDGNGVQADNEFDNRFGLRLSQRIYSFGRTGLAIEAARLRAEGERQTIRETEQGVAFEVGAQFVAIARGEEKVAAAQTMIGYYQRDAAQVDRRLDAGLLKLSEAAAIRAEDTRARARAAEEQLRLDQDREKLASLAGLAGPCLDVAEGDAALRTMQPPSFDVALSEAEQSSPVLANRAAQLAAARLDAQREGRARYPDIAIAGTSALDFNRGFDSVDRTSRIGLDLSVPLYQGGQIGGRVAVASAQARAADFQLAADRRSLSDEIAISWSRVRSLETIAGLDSQTLAALGAQAAATEREYEAGLIGLSELIEVRRNEYQARLAEIDTRYDLMIERVRLLSLTGRIFERGE